MPTRWRRTLRVTRRSVAYGLLAALITAAFLVSLANLLLPVIENNPVRVQAWLSDLVGQPVHYRASKTEWTRRGPRIELNGLTVGKGDQSVFISRAELLVAVYSGLFPNHPLTELKVKNLHLLMRQKADNSWELLGVPRQKNARTDALDVLSGFGELQIERSDLRIEPNASPVIAIPRIDMRLRVQGKQLSVGMRAQAKIGEAPLLLVARLNRQQYSGKLWLGGEKLVMSSWLAMLPSRYQPAVQADADLDIWADLKDRSISAMHGRLLLNDVREPGKGRLAFNLTRAKSDKNLLFDRIDTSWQWQRRAGGWQLNLGKTGFARGNRREQLDGVRLAVVSNRWQAEAEQVALQPFSRMAGLARGIWSAQVEALERAGLSGHLASIQASGQSDFKTWRLAGHAEALAFRPVGQAPGLSGISGVFVADEQGGSWRFKDKPVQLDWPLAFGRRVPSQLKGSIQWWRSGADWVVGAREMRWRGDGMGLDADAQIQFTAGKRAPHLYLSARLPTFDFATAKRFWPRHILHEPTIHWLDMALEKGEVRDGRVLIAGDLSEWPFANKNGRFKATARIAADKFKFAKDWPAADDTLLLADFNGPGFTASGNTTYLGNPVILGPSGIAEFKKAELRIAVSSRSRLGQLLPVLGNTPLKTAMGPQVTGLRGNGMVDTRIAMVFPLAKGKAFNTIDGAIQFSGNTIQSPDWNLMLANATGSARFDQKGFSALGVRGVMERTPVALDIRIGTDHVTDAGQRVQASIRGNFNADTLFGFHEDLADLQGIMKGSSAWQFDVSMPRMNGMAEAPVFLNAKSNLLGTAIALPIPLAKTASTSQDFQFRTQLPIDRGPLEFRIGPAFRLLLKKPANKPMSGLVLLGAQSNGSVPDNGFAVRGTSDELDVPGWLALANKGEGDVGLQDFDVSVNRLRLLGEDFGRTRLQILPSAESMLVKVEGARLDGTVNWPRTKGRAITANFARVHFVPDAAGSAPVTGAAVPATIDMGNPALFPPVLLRIEDARYGGVLIGRVDLQTQPSRQGLLIQKFSTQSAQLASNASGIWQGEGVQARTSLQAVVTSPDLGKTLTAANYPDVMRRGKTTAKLTGVWDGSPAEFSLIAFKGLLDLRIDEGQFPEVKAGGGRLLGLMSLAELPRRLSFNFNDFTDKGLGFNTIKGEFRFAEGLANTRNLRIDAPAADIRISGSTDLVNERFDQQVQVQPKAGGLLPVIGAATAGPIGAAAGVVAQAVLNKPLQEGTAIEYRISGPWNKPLVVKMTDAEK